MIDKQQLTELLKSNPLQSVTCKGKISLLRCFYDHPHIVKVTLDTGDELSVTDILQLIINRPKLDGLCVIASKIKFSCGEERSYLSICNKNELNEVGPDWIPLIQQMHRACTLSLEGSFHMSVLKCFGTFKGTLNSLTLSNFRDYDGCLCLLTHLPNLDELYYLSTTNISGLVCKYCTNLQALHIMGDRIRYTELMSIVQACRKLDYAEIQVDMCLDTDVIKSIAACIVHISKLILKSRYGGTAQTIIFRCGVVSN